jgi:hypothetical protein
MIGDQEILTQSVPFRCSVGVLRQGGLVQDWQNLKCSSNLIIYVIVRSRVAKAKTTPTPDRPSDATAGKIW